MIEIVMLTHNRLPALRICLHDLLPTIPHEGVKLTICAQGCTDGTNEFLQRLSESTNLDFDLAIAENNIGLARYKELIERSNADIIVTCDDDVWGFSPGWNCVFEMALMGDYAIGYVCAQPVNGTAGGLPKNALKGPVHLDDGLTFFPGKCGGWFAATTRDLIERVGWPHSQRSLFDLEDALYAGRVKQAGRLVGSVAEIEVYHACSIEDKVALGLADAVMKNAFEAQKAGWIDVAARDQVILKTERLRAICRQRMMEIVQRCCRPSAA